MRLLLCVVSWDIPVQVRNHYANCGSVDNVNHCVYAGADASNGRFGRSHTGQPLEFDDFGCRGSENSLLDCPRNLGQTCAYGDADVICSE